GNLLIAQPTFDKSTDSLMAKVMKAEFFQTNACFGVQPDLVEVVGPSLAVLARLSKENQVSVNGAHRVGQRLPEDLHRCIAEGYRARRGVLGLQKAHNASFQVYLTSA